MAHILKMNTLQKGHIPARTLRQIDDEFEQIGCLGHGGAGSVFLGRKRKSGRRVALKFMEDEDSFQREIDAVFKLNYLKDGEELRDLAIVFFEEWFQVENVGFSCIVMNYVDGGTLADEITAKNDFYTERRIAWYALQLSEALAYAHERGVAHHDVKSTNVLVDRKSGGRLLLTDFDTAVNPGEDSVGFSEMYASPELIAAHSMDDYTNIQADKVDAFGLGCILYELVSAAKMVELTGEQTLAEFIQTAGLDAALNSDCIKVGWKMSDSDTDGYSQSLRGLIKSLLVPQPEQRWLPSQITDPLRNDPLSPLLANYIVAAQPPIPGTAVTVDNVQVGMFVQRGEHWDDGEYHVDIGTIGVILQLDPDALYTSVVWPSQQNTEPSCCRIGAGNKFELKVGPVPIQDFYSGTAATMTNGLILNTANHVVGEFVNNNCRVLGIRKEFALVAPVAQIEIYTVPYTPIPIPTPPIASLRKLEEPPEEWQCDEILVEVRDVVEEEIVNNLFYSTNGGMDLSSFEITSIKRVQNVDMWRAYAQTRESIAAVNWGIANETRLFHGTCQDLPDASLCRSPGKIYKGNAGVATDSQTICFTQSASRADNFCHRKADGERQIVLSRVSLGRMLQRQASESVLHNCTCHSEEDNTKPLEVAIRSWTQAYPEYVISYKSLPIPGRRVVRAKRWPNHINPLSPPKNHSANATSRATVAGRSNGSHDCNGGFIQNPAQAGKPSSNLTSASTTMSQRSNDTSTKMCVVCLDRAVCRILVPCGHPCLCQVCSTMQGLNKLGRKCPECRTPIKDCVNFYGRVVND